MKKGTIIRQVVNKLNEIDFIASEDRQSFGDIYDSILSDSGVRVTMESFTLLTKLQKSWRKLLIRGLEKWFLTLPVVPGDF